MDVTASRKSSRSSAHRAEPVRALDGRRPWHVAEQGDLADVGGRLLDLRLAGKVDLERPLVEHVEAVAGVALLEEGLPGRELDLGESLAEIFERLGRQGGEKRHGTQRRQPLLRDASPMVDPLETPPAHERQHGEQRAHRDEGSAHADRRDQRGGDQRAERKRSDDHALEAAEDPRRDVGWRGPLQERHRGDVDHRVGEADDPEGQRRDHGGRDRADQEERKAPDDQPDRKVGGDAGATDERERDGGAEQRPDAAGGLQHADAGRAEAEQLQRDRDHEHPERSCNDTLDAVEPDQQAQPRLTSDRAEAGREGGDSTLVRHVGRLRDGRGANAGNEVRAPGKCEGDEAKGGGRPSERKQEGCDRRPRKDPEAVERARRDVRGRQFLGRPGEHRDQRRLGRPEDGAEHGGQRRDHVDRERRRVLRDEIRRHPDGDHPSEIRCEHHALAREAIAEGSGERRDEGGDHLADGRDDADRGRPAVFVGVDGNRNAVGELADRCARAGELHPPQVGIGVHAPHRGQRFLQATPELAHVPRIALFDKEWKVDGRFHSRPPSSGRQPQERVNGFKEASSV